MGLVLGIGGSRGETAVRGTERNGIVWDCHWLLVGAGAKRAVRGTEWNGIVCYWYRELGGARGESTVKGQSRTVLCGTGNGYWWEQGVRQL